MAEQYAEKVWWEQSPENPYAGVRLAKRVVMSSWVREVGVECDAIWAQAVAWLRDCPALAEVVVPLEFESGG